MMQMAAAFQAKSSHTLYITLMHSRVLLLHSLHSPVQIHHTKQ
jgi:hypothetical protein